MQKNDLVGRLAPFQQQHVLRFWDDLSPAGQKRLAEQVLALDMPQLAKLFAGDQQHVDWAEVSRRAEPAPAVRMADRNSASGGKLGFTREAAIARGKQALAAGEIGVVLVAGGQGSRLGFEHPKGMYPIGPVSKATLLQIHCEKVVALSRTYKATPLYLMTSPITHEEQLDFLARHNRFGLAEDDLVPFCQGTMPAVDAATGKLLLESRGALFESPDGHGGMVAALAKSGAIEHMRRRGVKHLFYLQVDNPIVPIGDPEFIGYHLLAESELTSMAVAKQEPMDKLGNFAMTDGKLNVIEYSDFPNDVAEQRDATGGLKFWAGSIAVHMFGVAFLERMLALKDALPFHIARKKVPHVGGDGKMVNPTEPNALKFERFIFDLLPQAKNPLVVEFAEAEVFAPLKNAPGAPKDTEAYVHQFLLAQHTGWLRAAGATVADGARIEISPLYALDAEQVKQRVKPGEQFSGVRYLK